MSLFEQKPQSEQFHWRWKETYDMKRKKTNRTKNAVIREKSLALPSLVYRSNKTTVWELKKRFSLLYVSFFLSFFLIKLHLDNNATRLNWDRTVWLHVDLSTYTNRHNEIHSPALVAMWACARDCLCAANWHFSQARQVFVCTEWSRLFIWLLFFVCTHK